MDTRPPIRVSRIVAKALLMSPDTTTVDHSRGEGLLPFPISTVNTSVLIIIIVLGHCQEPQIVVEAKTRGQTRDTRIRPRRSEQHSTVLLLPMARRRVLSTRGRWGVCVGDEHLEGLDSFGPYNVMAPPYTLRP